MSGETEGGVEDAGIGGIANNIISLKAVNELLRREVENSTLQQIEPDSYQRIALLISSLKGQDLEKGTMEADVRDRMVDLLSTSANLLFELRQSKVATTAAAVVVATQGTKRDVEGERAGEPTFDYSKLTDEEKYVLDGQQEASLRLSEVMSATTNGRPKVLEAISARLREKRIVVRFIKPQEQFIGMDMTKYGPFKQEDVAVLPLENARSFIETGAALQVRAKA